MNRKLLLAGLLIFTILVSGCIKNEKDNTTNISTSSQISTNNISDINKIPTGWIKRSNMEYFKNVSKGQISNVSVVVPVIIIMENSFSDSDTAKYYFDNIIAGWKGDTTKNEIETKKINILPDCLSTVSYYKRNVVGGSSQCLKNDKIITLILEGGKVYTNEEGWSYPGYPIDEKAYSFSLEDEINDMKVFVNLAYNNKI